MAKTFKVDSGGIVNGVHDAIRGEDQIELTGHDRFVVHAYIDDMDCCSHLVGDDCCPLKFNEPMKILSSAEIGEWRLGTNPDNDGRTGLSGHSVEFRPLTNNGSLNVGSG
jgi:hypothetical protein